MRRMRRSKKRKTSERALFDVQWKVSKPLIYAFCSSAMFQRVILDEGHQIRNPKTKMAKSVVALNASRRWVLTGTPIVSAFYAVSNRH